MAFTTKTHAQFWQIARTILPALTTLLIVSFAVAQSETTAADVDGSRTVRGHRGWPVAGHDLHNSRSQPAERHIGRSNVGRLEPKWVFTTEGDVTATPTVAGNSVYFPDWAGNLYAVRADDGRRLWSRKISDYNGRAGSASRVSPAIYEDELILGDHMMRGAFAVHDGAHVMAVDRHSGALRWITQVDSHPAAVITGSPVVHGTTIYVGVSSGEENLSANPQYPCCTFRGSVVALDVNTGAIRWQTYTVPDNGGQTNGYSGGGIWGPPAIDTARGSLYIGTGNNYKVPDDVLECQQRAIENHTPNANCTAADDYINTVLALDLKTGATKWARRLRPKFDAWTVACVVAPLSPNCPSPSGPDFDFGSGPNLLGDILGIGQKSGIYWALNPDNGAVVWKTLVGPGGLMGGIQWGTATDGKRIYVAVANNEHESYELANGGPRINWGSWAALDPRKGTILWQVPDPTPGAVDPAAVSIANGVMYAGSSSGSMYGLDSRSGRVLFDFASGGFVAGGPSIADGSVYWGSGRTGAISGGVSNNKVYAFTTRKGRKHDRDD